MAVGYAERRAPVARMVKNRCKNGDHYCVRATVAPIVEGGKITGYVSVRKAPTRNQITEAEALYRELNQSVRRLCRNMSASSSRTGR